MTTVEVMIVVSRYVVPADEAVEFVRLARTALGAFAARPGFVAGRVGRAIDDGELWVLGTEWRDVGSYRRALGSYEVKLHAVPLMYRAVDEPSAYEDLLTVDDDGRFSEHEPARSADADIAAPGRFDSR
jgi:hypothetical protein